MNDQGGGCLGFILFLLFMGFVVWSHISYDNEQDECLKLSGVQRSECLERLPDPAVP
ncbi:hypothetical protein SAMN05421505_101186 [Sinosporangium album]|uniref:Uncharacterized protein n=1 Tax=Sinosporangium album TaxID=504805 RepID=A0A1G7QZK9_9ACTN|nr:hypothetical protein [Sinosporangium album]SDG03956.1 hypothetical protein SAMN05421505_101186 [Sinosporangium album]